MVRRLLAILLAHAAILIVAAPAAAVAPGANGPIAFARGAGGLLQVFVVNPDGSFLSQVTNDPLGARLPVWFPDGRRLAYLTGSQLWVLDVFTGERRSPRSEDLISSEMFSGGGAEAPVWSPDGARIAYTNADLASGFNVFVAAREGPGPVNLTGGSGGGREPDWSPDGTRIVYSRNDGLYAINPDGSGRTKLRSTPPYASTPSWSPDASRIAFTSFDVFGPTAGTSEIHVMNADGSSETPISPGGRLYTRPVWSPDGSRIGFGRDRNLWTMNPDGSQATELAGGTTYLSWGSGPLLTRRLLPASDARKVNASVLGGKVLVKKRGSAAFEPLEGEEPIPYGSVVDTRRGRVRLTAPGGTAAQEPVSGDLSRGIFRVRRETGAVLGIDLVRGSRQVCPRADTGAEASGHRAHVLGEVLARARRRVRTRGRLSRSSPAGASASSTTAAATATAVWITKDRCDGTLTKVLRGRVKVQERRGRTLVLRAGSSHLARGALLTRRR